MALVIVIQGVLVTGIVQPKAGSLTQNVPQHENVYQSAGLPGEKPLLANVLPNPGFEQVDSYGGPLQWNYYGSAYTGSNASYTGLTYGGSYSGLLEAMGTQQWGTDAYMYRYLTSAPFAMLSQRIILNLFWDVRQNPDIARWAYAYIRLEMYNGSSWFYIYYALSFGNNVGSNSTHSSWIRLNNTLDAWHQLNRNVTSDFEKCFLMPVPTNMMLYDMFFYAVSPQQATGKITMVIDEISLRNSTLYEYLLDSNGNFEMGNGANWNTKSSYDPARVALTAEHTEGNHAVNMSCSASGSGLNRYASLYQYSYRGLFTEPDGLVVQFDYMYKDAQGGGTGQYAYVYVSYSNRSISGNVFWYLGRGSDLFDDVNSTYYCYTRADGFGSRGVWHHVTADVGSLLKQNHITNVAVQYLTFYVNAGSSANSSVQLLVDRVSVVTDPLGDPGFEQDTNLYFGPVPSWDIWSGGAPYVSQTASARTGKWAANLTAYGGTSAAIYRSMWLEMDSSVFTDFYWKLDSSPYASSTYVVVRLSFQGGYEVDYVLANVEAPTLIAVGRQHTMPQG